MDFNDMPRVAMLFVVLAIIGGVSMILLGRFQDNEEVEYSVTNETINCGTLGTTYYLDNNNTGWNYTQSGRTPFVEIDNSSIVASANRIYNATTGFYINGSTIVIDVTDGSYNCPATGIFKANENYTILDYDFVLGSQGRIVYGYGLDGITEIVGWMDIIAIVISAAIILSLVIGILAIFGTKKGQGPL